MIEEINKTFDMFSDAIPELKDLIKETKIMYNQKIKLENRISKAIEYIEDENIDITTIRFNDIQDVKKDLLNILKGDDKE